MGNVSRTKLPLYKRALDREGQLLLEARYLPYGIVRPIFEPTDLGEDFLLEALSSRDRLTAPGALQFYVQLKSRKKFSLSHSKKYLRVSGVRMKTINRWKQLPLPIFLFAYDASLGELFWLFLTEELLGPSKKNTRSFHISLKNVANDEGFSEIHVLVLREYLNRAVYRGNTISLRYHTVPQLTGNNVRNLLERFLLQGKYEDQVVAIRAIGDCSSNWAKSALLAAVRKFPILETEIIQHLPIPVPSEFVPIVLRHAPSDYWLDRRERKVFMERISSNPKAILRHCKLSSNLDTSAMSACLHYCRNDGLEVLMERALKAKNWEFMEKILGVIVDVGKPRMIKNRFIAAIEGGKCNDGQIFELLHALSKLKEKAPKQFILRMMKVGRSPYIRSKAARVLGRIGSKNDLRYVWRGLQKEIERIKKGLKFKHRASVYTSGYVHSIGQLGGPEDIQRLFEISRSQYDLGVDNLVYAASKIQCALSEDYLINVVMPDKRETSSWANLEPKKVAVEALCKCRTRKAEACLEALLSTASIDNCKAYLQDLLHWSSSSHAGEDDPDEYWDLFSKVAEGLVALQGRKAIPKICILLASDNHSAIKNISRLICNHAPRRAGRLLVQVLARRWNISPGTQLDVMAELSNIKCKSALLAILEWCERHPAQSKEAIGCVNTILNKEFTTVEDARSYVKSLTKRKMIGKQIPLKIGRKLGALLRDE